MSWCVPAACRLASNSALCFLHRPACCQVHPTGLVEPNDPDAKIKFLAAEALRGVGGLIFNGDGERFCNELGRRDYVTGEMWKSKPPFRLALNKAASTEMIWHCKHYTGQLPQISSLCMMSS